MKIVPILIKRSFNWPIICINKTFAVEKNAC